MFSLFVAIAVFLLISIRQIGKFKLEMWQIMSFGAIAVLLAGEISFKEAVKAIDFNVIVFLFGMFVASALFELSGYLEYNQYRIFQRAKNIEQVFYIFIFFCAILSAVVMNDTMAIIATPVAISLAKRYDISAKPFLLALCFSITIGSVMSPIGNPQNLLIAINSRMSNPFLSFIRFLFIPTFLNLLLLFFIVKFFYPDVFKNARMKTMPMPEKKKWLYFLSQLTMAIIILGIISKIYFSLHHKQFNIVYIAIFASMPALFLSFRQIKILKMVDFKTLIFFMAMFILMRALWNSNFLQDIIEKFSINILSFYFIFFIVVILSQFISNVPLVALFLPLMINAAAGEKHFLSLAASSTIAGNLSILGAASNVIVIQNSENRIGETISFWEFVKIGLPLTFLNSLIYWLFLK
jgi:Na+/H+ antiporter NhaD/arsenite permease-like protein